MGKIGTTELWTQSEGWVEVDLYDPADFTFTPLELPTGSGTWGVPYVSDASNADTPIEFYTQSNGWVGVNSVGFVLIEDFEDGDLDEWVESKTTASEVSSARAAFQGNYGLNLTADTCERIVSHSSFSPSLSYYPQQGDQFELFFRWDSTDAFTDSTWLKFGNQNYPTSDGFTSHDVSQGYLFSMRPKLDDVIIGRTDSDDTFVEDSITNVSGGFHADQWYRMEVDWHYSTNDDIIGRVYEVTKDDPVGTEVVSVTHFDDNTYSSGAVEFAGQDPTHMDYFRKTAPL